MQEPMTSWQKWKLGFSQCTLPFMSRVMVHHKLLQQQKLLSVMSVLSPLLGKRTIFTGSVIIKKTQHSYILWTWNLTCVHVLWVSILERQNNCFSVVCCWPRTRKKCEKQVGAAKVCTAGTVTVCRFKLVYLPWRELKPGGLAKSHCQHLHIIFGVVD